MSAERSALNKWGFYLLTLPFVVLLAFLCIILFLLFVALGYKESATRLHELLTAFAAWYGERVP